MFTSFIDVFFCIFADIFSWIISCSIKRFLDCVLYVIMRLFKSKISNCIRFELLNKRVEKDKIFESVLMVLNL